MQITSSALYWLSDVERSSKRQDKTREQQKRHKSQLADVSGDETAQRREGEAGREMEEGRRRRLPFAIVLHEFYENL